MIAYLTDVEGQWEKLEGFVARTPGLSLEGGALRLAPGVTFVFGGDAVDRGPDGRRVVRALLDAKLRHGDAVVLIAGNRDINKLRLLRELRGATPPKPVPDALRGASPGALLPWIMANTMGARQAFEHRRAELAREGAATDDEAVAESFVDDVRPEGLMTRYLARCQLAWLGDATLVVHGAVTAENLGFVPGEADRCARVADWVAGLNRFYRSELDAWREATRGDFDPRDARYPGRALVDYQCPVADTKLNQASVVYGRPTDDAFAPWLPPRAVVDALRRDGVARLLVGHTPAGDAPAALRDEGFTFVMADNSYGRHERASRVAVEGGAVRARGETILDDGARVEVAWEAPGDGLLGLRDADSGQLVKARLATDDYLLFRPAAGNAVEQVAASPSSLRARRLVPPYRDGV